MGNPQQYSPLPREYLAVGIIGIFLYLLILYFSIASMLLGFRSKSTKRFFGTIMIMSLLELPRYFALAVDESYTSKTTYCFHIFAGIFFFLAFSIVCRQWSGLLQLGSYFRVVYGYHGLLISNILFAVMDIISVVLCATSRSLDEYFDSTSFEVFTFMQAIRNCIYSIFLTYYGLKLVQRFGHFSKLEKQSMKRHEASFSQYQQPRASEQSQQSSHTKSGSFSLMNWSSSFSLFRPSSLSASHHNPIASSLENPSLGPNNPPIVPKTKLSLPVYDQVFTRVVVRLTWVLSITTICFVFRLAMLCMKLIVLNSSRTFTTPDFSLFGLLWFTCSDFIPRVLPSFAYIFLMRTKKPKSDQISAYQKSGRTTHKGVIGGGTSTDGGKGAFQFVVLASEEDGLGDESYDLSYRYENPMYSTSTGNSSIEARQISFLQNDQFLSDEYYYDHQQQQQQKQETTGRGMNPNHSMTSFENLNKTNSFPKFTIEDFQTYEETTRMMQHNPHQPSDFLRDGLSMDEEEEDEDEEDDDNDGLPDPGEKALDTIFSLLSLSSAKKEDTNSGNNSRSSSISRK
jgi:hypothetical protein